MWVDLVDLKYRTGKRKTNKTARGRKQGWKMQDWKMKDPQHIFLAEEYSLSYC